MSRYRGLKNFPSTEHPRFTTNKVLQNVLEKNAVKLKSECRSFPQNLMKDKKFKNGEVLKVNMSEHGKF
jgi:hypothetical protein